MSVKQIIINSDASTTASAVVSGANRTPTNFPELVFGDSYSIVVKFTGNSEDGFVAPDSSAQYLFNIGALSRATMGTFEISYDGEYTDVLPFNASADMIATALNSLPKIVSAGGVNVSGTDGSPYRIIFKQNGSRKNFEIRSNLFPDTNPIVHIVNSGDDNSCCEILIVLKLDTIASVSNYIVNQSAKELRFDVSLNTVECLLALGTSDKVRLLAELKRIDSNGNVFTYSQTQCTIHNRLIDVNTLEYATIELTGVLESVKAIEKKMADLYSPCTIERKGEFWFNGGTLQIDSLKYVQGNPFSFAVNFKANKDYFVNAGQVSILDCGILYLYFHANLKLLSFYAPNALNLLSVDKRVNDRLLNGQIHSLIVTYDGTTLKLTDETGELMSTSVTLQSQGSSSKTKIGSNLNGQLSNIKYFNFDISDANAPYTLSDYQQGKPIPPLLQTTQPVIDWHNLNANTQSTTQTKGQSGTLELNCTDSGGSYPRIFENGTFKVGYTYYIRLSGKVLFPSGQTGVSLRLKLPTSTAEITNNLTGEVVVSTPSNSQYIFGQGQGFEFDRTIKFIPTETNTDSNCLFYFNPIAPDSNSYVNVSVRCDSALLSLEDYTFNGKVFDTSSNNNTATITGAVKGTRDNAVERMYQAFASRIGNLTME